MLSSVWHAQSMSTKAITARGPEVPQLPRDPDRMIQIRNVPDPLHRTLKAKAAMEGLTLSDFLLREIRKVAERPTNAELRARILATPKVTADVDVTALMRGEREERAGQIVTAALRKRK